MTQPQNPGLSPHDPQPLPAKRTWQQSLLLILGSIGPLGHAPASGTVAVAVAGIPLVWLMGRYLNPTVYAAVTVAFVLASMALHHAGDRILGESDSRRLVWDELAGFFVAMFMVPFGVRTVIAGFLIERFIDIVKVPPADIIDRKWHNGAGVVLDDVIAGIYTCLILHALLRWTTWLAG